MMSDSLPPATVLEYAPPNTQRNWITRAIVSGVVTGAVGYGAAYVLSGTLNHLVIWSFLGLCAGYFNSRRSADFIWRSSITCNSTAAITIMCGWGVMIALFARIRSFGFRNALDILETLAMTLAAFIIPGCLASLWVWEGKRSERIMP
jgi:hypothetical protein